MTGIRVELGMHVVQDERMEQQVRHEEAYNAFAPHVALLIGYVLQEAKKEVRRLMGLEQTTKGMRFLRTTGMDAVDFHRAWTSEIVQKLVHRFVRQMLQEPRPPEAIDTLYRDVAHELGVDPQFVAEAQRLRMAHPRYQAPAGDPHVLGRPEAEEALPTDRDITDDTRLQLALSFNEIGYEQFEEVRAAEFLPITPACVDEMLEQYLEAWMTPETLAAFVRGDMEPVYTAMRQGKYLYGPDEPGGAAGGLSIREALKTRLGLPREQGRVTGWGLRSNRTGKLISWLYYDELAADGMRELLTRGSSGGGMRYSAWMDFQQRLAADPMAVQDAGTLRGTIPFAANRLFAKALTKMREDNDNLKFLIASILRAFKVRRREPPVAAEVPQRSRGGRRRRLVLPPQKTFTGMADPKGNLKSRAFTAARGMVKFAEDWNDDGAPSLRETEVGTVEAYPVWEWLYAPFDEAEAASRHEWNKIRWGFRDRDDDD